jgi:hypothetical protein
MAGSFYRIVIKCPTLPESGFEVSLATEATVLDLKEAIAEECEGTAQVSSQRLIYGGKVLADSTALVETFKKVWSRLRRASTRRTILRVCVSDKPCLPPVPVSSHGTSAHGTSAHPNRLSRTSTLCTRYT